MSSLWPVLLLAGILPFGGDGDVSQFPIEAEGNIPFHLDAARFRGPAGAELEIFLSIPQENLAESPDSAGYRHVLVEVRFEDLDGDRIGAIEEEFWFPDEESGTEAGILRPRHLLTLRPRMPEGAGQLAVKVTDPSGRKRGLLDRIRGKKPSGRARARFINRMDDCGLSDLVFAWELGGRESSETVSPRKRLRPNPQHFVGLFQTNLLVFLEHYNGPATLAFEIDRYPDHQVIASGSESTGHADGSAHPWLLGRDISALPTGAYRLSVWNPKNDSCRVTADFQVLWDVASWNQDQKALLDEAFVLLGPNEYGQFREMSRGEMEAYLQTLWTDHDPDPSTGRNELRELFLERVRHANRFYGNTFREGMLTDRGRVYVRYGPPDEITKELNPQDQSVLANVLPGEVETDRVDIIRKPIQRDTHDHRAYEIWNYQVRGRPLFPEQMNPVQRTGLKFIFVDELGYGDMRLIYTNLAGAF